MKLLVLLCIIVCFQCLLLYFFSWRQWAYRAITFSIVLNKLAATDLSIIFINLIET